MRTKYEIASEAYKLVNGTWRLIGVPQHVAMFNSYEEAVRAYGTFENELPSRYGTKVIRVYSLYALILDKNEDAIDAIGMGYKVLSTVKK